MILSVYLRVLESELNRSSLLYLAKAASRERVQEDTERLASC